MDSEDNFNHQPMEGKDGVEEDEDMDGLLLQQFSCMGTTDKDVLISEFIRLLDPNQLSPEGAAFFLDMNNWNLQQAICAYFDFDAPKELLNQKALPGMIFLKDVTIGEGEEVPPSTKFVKTWRIQNSGIEKWPPGCVLRFVSGDQMASCERVLVNPLEVGHCCDVSVEMVSPAKAGIYQGQWRMSTATGQFFGEVIWVIISVAEGGLLGLTQQMDSFHSLGSPVRSLPTTFTNENHNPRNPFASGNGYVNNQENLMNSVSSRPLRRELITRETPSPRLGPILDRLQGTPSDDNQENCFKVCNSVLTRTALHPSDMSSPSICLNTRLVSPPTETPFEGQVPSMGVGGGGGDATATGNQVAAYNQLEQFPPTPPPSEDMVL